METEISCFKYNNETRFPNNSSENKFSSDNFASSFLINLRFLLNLV